MIIIKELKNIYSLMPYILPTWLMLNIIGNTIKMTFKLDSKHIVWILLVISILINFIFFGISFESLFIAFVTFSFAVSSYDLVKFFSKLRNKRL